MRLPPKRTNAVAVAAAPNPSRLPGTLLPFRLGLLVQLHREDGEVQERLHLSGQHPSEPERPLAVIFRKTGQTLRPPCRPSVSVSLRLCKSRESGELL